MYVPTIFGINRDIMPVDQDNNKHMFHNVLSEREGTEQWDEGTQA